MRLKCRQHGTIVEAYTSKSPLAHHGLPAACCRDCGAWERTRTGFRDPYQLSFPSMAWSLSAATRWSTRSTLKRWNRQWGVWLNSAVLSSLHCGPHWMDMRQLLRRVGAPGYESSASVVRFRRGRLESRPRKVDL